MFHSPIRSLGPSLEAAHFLSVLTLVKFELVATMVLALFFAAMELQCGLAPLEHGLLCGLANVGLAPRQCAATPVLPCVEFVGAESVSGTPGAGVFACVVATEAEKVSCFSEVVLSYIFKVSEWEAAAITSVGCMFMDSGNFLKFTYPFACLVRMRRTCTAAVILWVPPW